MSNSFQQKSDQISGSVNKSYRNFLWRRQIARFILPFSVLLIIFSLIFWLESGLYLSGVVKTFLMLTGLISAVATFRWLNYQLPTSDYRTYYDQASRHMELEALRNLLDLSGTPGDRRTRLSDAAVRQNMDQIDNSDLDRKLKSYNRESSPSTFLTYGIYTALIPLIILPLLLHFHPDALVRTSLFWKEFERPNPFAYIVDPGNSILEQGTQFQVRADFDGDNIPDNLNLLIRTGIENQYRARQMQRVGESSFYSDFIELFNDVSYYVKMDGFKSETYSIEVQLLPRFTGLEVTMDPPGYTKLDKTTYQYPFSRIEAFPGSRLTVTAKPNKPLAGNELIRHNSSDTLSAGMSDGIANWTLDVAGADSISFELQDEHNLVNKNKFSFVISGLTDNPPVARILQPEQEVSVLEPKVIDVTYKIEDDFGFTSVRLNYSVIRAFSDKAENSSIRLPVPGHRAHIDQYRWDLSELRLQPLDRVEYWIEATDNDSVSGYKTGRSATHIIRAASMAEYLLDQDEKEQSVSDSFDKARNEFEEMQRELEELRNNLRENPDDNWQNQRNIEDIQDRSSNLSEQIEEIQREFEELRKDLQENELLSEETLQKYNELQDLMSEIDDPELRKALEELQKSMENMDPNQMREAMQNLEFNEQSYKERLERTIDLFKDLRLNADLEKMARLLEELSKQEERLLQDSDSREEQINQQKMIREELQQAREKIDKLPDTGPEKRRDMMEQLRDDVGGDMDMVGDQLEQNIDEMNQGGDDDSIRDSQQQIQQKLQQLSEDVRNSMAAMQQEQVNINVTALQSILQNLILLSEAQEDVNEVTRRITENSSVFVDQARKQRNITRSFEQVSDSLFKVSSEIPQFSNRINEKKNEVMRNLDRTVSYQANRDRARSSAQERLSLGGINEVAVMVADLLEQIQNSDGSGGGGMSAQQMLQKIQQMGQDQQQLNQQITDFINDMQGERLSQDQMERLDQMARQQNQIRRQLQQMREGGGLRGGDQLMSEMQRMIEQMEDTINDLRGGSSDRILVERQQNILSRMLEAERALQERGEDDERRGDRVTEYQRSSPEDLTLEELQKRIRSAMQDPARTRFSRDYQILIERYFELLQEQMNRNAPPEGS